MKYDIYFHGSCFDGVASAAVLKYFLNLRGDDFANYIPVTHPVDKNKWRSLKPKNLMAITDIFFHPKVKIYFDHHPSTFFLFPEWKKKFQKDKFHVSNSQSPSCAGLIYRSLYKNIKTPAHIKELVYWADLTDRASFKDAKEAMGLKPKPAIKLATYMDNAKSLSINYQKNIIKLLAQKGLSFIRKDSRIKKGFLNYQKRLKQSLLKIKNNSSVIGNTVVIKNFNRELAGTRFAGYHIYPKTNYSIRFLKRDGEFITSVGVNPWNLPKKHAKIGKFLETNFGGGGHAYAGSASFKTEKETLRGIEKIVKYLNKNK
ncbi:hypothetical protein HYS99_01645 [Candidatus Giovannonibacteria bacterium]|nr:hypothetical protein [Candidatus Giovannonibacteria bacterium]